MTRRYSDQPGYNCYDHENGLEKSAQKYFQITPPGPLGTAQAFVNTTAYDLHKTQAANETSVLRSRDLY